MEYLSIAVKLEGDICGLFFVGDVPAPQRMEPAHSSGTGRIILYPIKS